MTLGWQSHVGVTRNLSLVGAAALGGGWERKGTTRPPLTRTGIAEYAAVLNAVTWKSPGTSSNWNNGANWNNGSGLGGIPGSTDTVTLGTTNSAYTVTFDLSSTTIAGLTLDAGTGNGNNTTLQLNGGSLTVSGTTALTNGTNGKAIIDGQGIFSVGAAISGGGTIQAGTATTGGTLEITGAGSISSGVVLAIGSAAASDLMINVTAISAAPITLNSSNQTWRSAAPEI